MPRRTITKETVLNFVNENNLNIEFINLDKIADDSGRVRIWVNYFCQCGSKYSKTWTNFKKSSLCIKCGKGKSKNNKHRIKYSKSYVIKTLKENGFVILGEYHNSGTAFTYKCLTCGNVGRTNFGNFLSGRRCRQCLGLSKRDTESFQRIVDAESNNEYLVIGNYKTAHIKIDMKHKKCNTIYSTTPHNFLRGRRCPKCSRSVGEELIENYLIDNKIEYKTQYSIEECRNVNPLRFDFAIFKNGLLEMLIEYDGQQHFYPIDHFGGIEGFNETKRNDEIKEDFCRTNKIKLLRMPYWKKESVLEELKEEINVERVVETS